ncbi:hypothetical protein FOZ62_022986 [Perkinsus olseni]|nr:hypothetical protein FOZ62_022986 [Perkinsus olseni]
MCHSLSGLMMLFLPPQYLLCRLYVYAVVIVGLVMTWQLVPALPKWRFGDYGDIGITVYLIIVGFWFYSEYPVAVLAPIFFADPSGAVIGKWASRNLPEYNPTWVGKKTVIGSLAVFVVTFLTLYRPLAFIPRLLTSLATMLVEGFGGKFDNLYIALLRIMEHSETACEVGAPPGNPSSRNSSGACPVALYGVIIPNIAQLLEFLFQFDEKHISLFAARKLCHAGSGFAMLFLTPHLFVNRLYIYGVVVLSLAMTWSLIPGIPNWRFGAYEDPGITIYLLVVGFWYFMELPIAVLAPVFFADPAGAVVGKWASANIPSFNPPWIGKKTVLGSAAVFAVAFVSLHTPTSLLPRLLVSLVIAVAEALGSSFSSKAMMTTVSLVPDIDLPVPVGVLLMALEGVFLLVLQFDKRHISNFAARKLCHAGTGLLMLCLNSKYIINRLFIYALVVVSLTMTWELTPKLPNWRFGIYGDVGITIYLLVVG